MIELVSNRTPEHLAALLNLFVTAADRVADSRSPDLLAQAAIVKAARMSAFSSVAGLVDRLEQVASGLPPAPLASPASPPPARPSLVQPLRVRRACRINETAPVAATPHPLPAGRQPPLPSRFRRPVAAGVPARPPVGLWPRPWPG